MTVAPGLVRHQHATCMQQLMRPLPDFVRGRLVARLQPFAGMAHLDVAGGTGDVAFRVLRAMRGDQLLRQEEQGGDASAEGVPLGLVTVCDINPDMLAEGRRKAARAQALGKGPHPPAAIAA